MSDEPLAFLDQQPETPVTGTQPPATETTQTAPAVDSQQPVPVVPEEDQVDGEVKQVPLATFLDMRDKLKQSEARLKELEPTEQAFTPPDPVKNPVEFAGFQREQTNLAILNERMNTSERFARKEHGEEVVDKARDWALERMKTDEEFTRRVMTNPDPYEVAIKEYNRDQMFTGMTPEKVAAFRKWEAEQNGGQPPAASTVVQPAAVTQTPAAKVTPKPAPKSIAGTPATAGPVNDIAVGQGQAFDSMFKT